MIFIVFDYLCRHVAALKGLYGDQLLINLLGNKEGESYLTRAYQVKIIYSLKNMAWKQCSLVCLIIFIILFKDHLKTSSHSGDTPLILFDYHALCKGGKKDKLEMLKKKAEPYLDKFQVFVRKGQEIIRYFFHVHDCQLLPNTFTIIPIIKLLIKFKV